MQTTLDIIDVRLADIDVQNILDSLNDGVYVCGLDRRIVYWSKSAERITGWSANEVVGRACSDNILCHIDQEGNPLCSKACCPLHRSIVTGVRSRDPLLIYAKGKNGQRIPTLVSVAPLCDSEGTVLGGVESFQEVTNLVHDLERARTIQEIAMRQDLPADERIRFTTHYVSHGIVGGDFYAIKKLDDDRYGVILADVMGHGIAAAIYTMHLSALWNQYHPLLFKPAKFATTLNHELAKVVKTDTSFATAICGVVDLKHQTFRFTSAGAPHLLLLREDGTHEFLKRSGLPLALLAEADYEETSLPVHQGDRLVLFSDGVIEVRNAYGKTLGYDGLLDLLEKQNYPAGEIQMATLEADLLNYSNAIRLEDDLTLLEIHLL